MGDHFYRRTPYNKETQEQIWSTIFTDSHDAFCGCCQPLAHLLTHLIPPDHKFRHWTVDQIIQRELLQNKCLFGGAEEAAGGMADAAAGPSENIKEEDQKEEFTDVQIEELIAAADAVEER
nr:MAG: hypothetical protein [Gammatorquevirus sp.]